MHKNTTRATLAAALLLLFGFPSAWAQDDGKGHYWLNPEAVVWVNGDGECWYTPNAPREEPREECGDVVAQAPEPEPEPEPRVVTTTEKISVDARTLFGFDKAVLTADGRSTLRALARKVEADWEIERIRILGHTDPIGSEEYNQALSERRAQSVFSYLQTLPLAQYPMRTVGLGESRLIVQCNDVSERAARIECLQPNRRVDIEVTGVKTTRKTIQK